MSGNIVTQILKSVGLNLTHHLTPDEDEKVPLHQFPTLTEK